MSAGTLALTNGSTTVTGSSTVFQTDLAVNDFIVCKIGGTTYTLGVSTIGSNTALTLTQPFTGPTTSGVAWYAVPNQTLVGITTELAANLTTVYRSVLVNDANWTKVFSQSANITVTLKDGTTFTGPSWGYIATQFGNKLDKTQNLSDLPDKAVSRSNLGFVDGALPLALGGTGAKTAADARTSLQLGAMATKVSVSRAELNTELFNNLFASGSRAANTQGAGVYTFNNTPFGFNTQFGTILQVNNRSDTSAAAGNGVWQHYLALGTNGEIIYAYNINAAYSARKVYTTGNTTTNSSGALVPASPIVRIVNDREAVSRTDILGVANAEYNWSTKRGLYNEESKGCTVSRTDVGTYLIKGAAGLAKDLWTVMDCGNGQGRIIALADAEETVDGIVVHCYKQKYTLSDDGDLTIEKGTLIDIPNDTWIDVRLEMPADSDYNLRQKEIADQIEAQQDIEEAKTS